MRHTCTTCRFCKCGVPMDEEPCNSCHVVTVNEFTNWQSEILTNADRIRAMCDEDLALFLETATEHGRVSEAEWMTWLKGKAQI